ncbi:TetR/AcrR family transcriptional regulator [Actinomyces sp.]|uniref:TetR/AcrR family transcriptional regulator n=1 Tax=Actinomyces sp. TaxID=29317 RepID=UPI0026DD2BBB|nr:TetR/AcrR family transcriptional regulator C-terminal ligand-binding domain-containing protein [Actinomyces sp.]MDO4655238.1 TetR/AcrR family transcriptional regulator C-terminal ligand-binding domain-containing protein [Actinomyces sp.]
MKPSSGGEATEVCVKNAVRPRPGGRSARVRRAVLDVVVELLEEGGVQAVTIAEVAARSGVNASSIYRRWHGVDALILDAAQDLSLGAIDVADTGSLEGDLCATTVSVAAFLGTDLGVAMARALIHVSPEVLERLSDWPQFWSTRLRRFEPVFARAAARGEVADDVDQSVIASIGEMIAAQTYFLTLFRREEVDDAAARRIVRRALVAAGL